MILLALIAVPFLAGLLLLVARPNARARSIAMVASLTCTVIVLAQCWNFGGAELTFIDRDWVPDWGLRLKMGYDGIGLLMLMLTAVIFPFIIGAGAKEEQDRPALANALLLFTQSFLFGVFTAQNALLFYIHYELSLIPLFLYLLYWGTPSLEGSSGRGGADRRTITMRFFIYTLFGGLALLFGIAYCVVQEPSHSADFSALQALRLPIDVQVWLFWALFLAFAVKLPIFPFHSWQPDTYTMAPMQGTMVLGGVLLKMGLFGVLRFVFPIVPQGTDHWRDLVVWLSIIGAIYAGWIAFRQTDFKRLVAYSSLSHVGIMTAALFTWTTYGITGSLYQAFAHAVLVVCMLYIVGAVERRMGTRDLSVMAGLKLKSPRLAALFFLVMVNGIALPLTQSFVGEWLMFNGLWQMEGGAWMTAVAVCTIILGAVYMLYAYQRVMLGPETRVAPGTSLNEVAEADANDHLFLVPLIAITLVFGSYPAPVLDLVQSSVQTLLSTLN